MSVMSCGYDEDISSNPFFLLLSTQYAAVLERVARHGWTVCVPRRYYDSNFHLHTATSSSSTVLCHILVPDTSQALDTGRYITLTDQHVRRLGTKVLFIEDDGQEEEEHLSCRSVEVLFEETVYTAAAATHSYTVWCVAAPLCSPLSRGEDEVSEQQQDRTDGEGTDPSHAGHDHQTSDTQTGEEPASLADCLDVLYQHGCIDTSDSPWQHQLSHKQRCQRPLDVIGRYCAEFAARLTLWPAPSITQLSAAVGEVFTAALEHLLYVTSVVEDGGGAGSSVNSPHLPLAVETYVVCALYDRLMHKIRPTTRSADAAINRAVQRAAVSCYQQEPPRRLKWHVARVAAHFEVLARQRHPLGKFAALRRIVRQLCSSTLDAHATAASQDQQQLLTADDLLAVFTAAVGRARVADWTVQLAVMQHLHVSVSHGPAPAAAAASCVDQYGYLVTTVEAAVRHVSSGLRQNDTASDATEVDQRLEAVVADCRHCDTPQQLCLFRAAACDDVAVLRDILLRAENTSEKTSGKTASSVDDDSEAVRAAWCHPLCDCQRCHALVAASSSSPCSSGASAVQCRDRLGRGPLHLAARHDSCRCLQVLLLHETDVVLDARDYHGLTAAHHAALAGRQTALLLLLQAGCAVDLQCQQGRSVLHAAVACARQSCVSAVLAVCECRGVHVLSSVLAAGDMRGDTALHVAARLGYELIVRQLINHGASVEATNHTRQSAADVAYDGALRRQMHLWRRQYCLTAPAALLPVLELRGTDDSAICDDTITPETETTGAHHAALTRRAFAAVRAGDEPLACFYLNIQYDSPSTCPHENSALPEASVATCAASGETLLHAAMSARMLSLARGLVRVGAAAVVEARDTAGRTPLHCACAVGFTAGCEFLLATGAHVNARDKQLRCPLHVACEAAHAQCVRLLLEAGAEVSAHDHCQRTAADLLINQSLDGASSEYSVIAQLLAVYRATRVVQ